MSGEGGNPASCGGSCCTCGRLVGDPAAGSWHGWRLVLAAVGTFLLPLFAALAGATLGGGSPNQQLAGCAGGLCVGVVLAKGLTALLTATGVTQHGVARD